MKKRRKVLAISLSIAMILLSLSGCGKSSNDSGMASDINAIYGEVSKIQDNTITIKVGTQTAMEKSWDKNKENREISGESESKGRPSMLELTGEEKEIKITEDTVIVKQQMGKHSGEKMGNPPEMPSGDEQGNPPEIPSGDNQGNPPEIPSGDNQGENKKEFSQRGDMKQVETEAITIEDISEGDIVKIILEDDGKAKEITVISMDNGNQPGSGQTDEAKSVDRELS